MKIGTLFLFSLLSSLLLFPIFLGARYDNKATREAIFWQAFLNQESSSILSPVYIRLQALQEGSVTFWESLPQNFSDHVSTMDSKILAMFISSNSFGLNLTRDNVGNLWTSANYSLNEGDYVDTLVWVSSRIISENLTNLGFVQFPENYPEDAKIFLNNGRKMPVDNQTIQTIAANYNQTENMTETVQGVIDFVSKQKYDPDKTRLLMSGALNTTDMLDTFEDALEVYETNSSMCLERAWYASAILRAAGVPTRTVTDVRLKSWIQVWLPKYGWVDAEALCVQPPPMFPRPLLSSPPWMIENSSDAAFPFTWLPKIRMRVANLTFSNVDLFNVNGYGTVLSEPVDADLFETDPTKYSFPIIFNPEIIYASITQQESKLTFSLTKGKENASKMLILGESNSVSLGDIAVSFRPTRLGNFVILQDFAVYGIWKFDFGLTIAVIGVPLVIVVVVWFYWKRRIHNHDG